MHVANITVSGVTAILEKAPEEKLKEQVRKLLEGTTITNANLAIVRRVPADPSGPGITLQHVVEKGLQIVVQGETEGKERYRCVLSTDTRAGEDLRKELVEAAKTASNLRVRIVDVARTRLPKRASSNRARGGGATRVGFLMDAQSAEKVFVVLGKLFMNKSQVPTSTITNRLIRDLHLTCAKTALGGVYASLRRQNYLAPGEAHTYVLTHQGRLRCGLGSLKKVASHDEQGTLASKVSQLEGVEALHQQLSAQIAETEKLLEKQKHAFEELLPSLDRLRKVREILV